MGADALVQWTARTWPSSCSNHGTELFFTNDDGTYFLDMWNLMPERGEISTLSGKSRRRPGRLHPGAGARRQEASSSPGRAQLPTGLPGLFVFNHWNANKPGTTLFLPVSNMTLEYINLLFIYFSPEYRFTLVDETQRRAARPASSAGSTRAGSTRPARWASSSSSSGCCRCRSSSRPSSARTSTSPCRRWGSGGWTYTGYIARFVLGRRWTCPGLGFRFDEAKRGPSVPVGRDGVFEAFTPPYHADMGAAVDAFLEAQVVAVRRATSPRPTSSRTG